MDRSDLTLLALHGLRLKGFVDSDVVADLWVLDPRAVVDELEALADRDLVTFSESGLVGWGLTKAGRLENERLLAAQVKALGARPAITKGHERFAPLNERLLAACTAWQVRDGAINDHDDATYDASVIAELAAIHNDVEPLVEELADSVDRFSIHEPRLSAAVAKVQAGEDGWFTKPIVESYHTVWFELHEDLLATLGLDRAAEGSANYD